jgi:drug/metabolite transporter (DMT)-like permease
VADHSRTGIDLSTRAWAELLLLSLIWGGIFLAIAVAERELGPFTVVLFRVGGGATLLWLLVAARRLPVPRRPAAWGGFLVMGCLNNAIPFTLIAWGLAQTGTGIASMLNATTAVFGVLVAAACFADEPLTARRLAGVALGFAGVVAIKGPGRLGALDPQALGTWAVLGGALSYALAGAWAKRWLSGHPPMVAAAGMLTGSTLVMAPLTLVVKGVPSLDLAASTWAALVATAGAYLLYYRVLAMAGAGNLLLCTLIIPLVAVALGATFLGEPLEPHAVAGFALIAAGLAVIDGRVLGLVGYAPSRPRMATSQKASPEAAPHAKPTPAKKRVT